MYSSNYYDTIDPDIDVEELAEQEYLQEIKNNTFMYLHIHTEDEWYLDKM